MRTPRTLLIWLAVAGLIAGACGEDGGDTAEDDAAATTSQPADDTTEETTGSATGATVQVADNPEFGEILVGPNGHTLYLFEKDQGTTTACTGGCANAWPALSAAGEPTAGEGIDETKLSTADGQVPNHVTYNGHLLYFFARDTAPGEVKGIDVEAWFPVNPAGEKVERGEG